MECLPLELHQQIGTFLHPWDYVKFCIATNQRPDPQFLWKYYFRVRYIPDNNLFDSLWLYRRTAEDEWTCVFMESVSSWSWDLVYEKGIDGHLRRRTISYVERCGEGRQWSLPSGDQICTPQTRQCGSNNSHLLENRRHFNSLADAMIEEIDRDAPFFNKKRRRVV